jgi:prepilin-type N-terminal cleavage/methylation domain-containing protein
MVTCLRRGKSSPDALDKRDIEKAFSLVELSIVLVILGLLTGGILAGQSLIRAAELRSVSTSIVRFSTAILTFQDKYLALPGDIANATAFWGKDDAACATQSGTTMTPGTCNGNGNGIVGFQINNNTATENYEMFRAWQHLANAGLVEGNYTGIAGSINVRDADVGRNVPNTRITNVGIMYGYITLSTGLFADITGKNIFMIGGEDNSSTSPAGGAGPTWLPFLTPAEAYNVDMKLDDGKPGSGSIRPMGGTCTDTQVIATAQFVLQNNAKDCSINYLF